MSTRNVYLGIVLLLVIILIAFFVWKKPREGFAPDSPAAPIVRDAVGNLFASLKALVGLGRGFQDRAMKYNRPGIEGEYYSVTLVTKALDNAERMISGSPPLLANYLAVYRGLSGSDRSLLDASDAYIEAGLALQQRVLNDSLDGAKHDSELGAELITLGQQLRRVVANVHRLGSALDVE
jgi:hypothetical protein